MAVPFDVLRRPVDDLSCRPVLEINEVQPTVALALQAAAYNKTGKQLAYMSPKPLRTVSQNVRGRNWARICR
jgi:hypothetical protein